MLPFPKDNDVKTFVCFVCGVGYTNFNEFTEHIITNHEEGREYIKCPLKRCGACVRDMRQHFKTKHPTEKMPNIGQMKALIWKDQNYKTGKMKQRKTKFREGYMTSAKNGGKQMHYRSGFECDFYECLEAKKNVICYEVEPVAIQYSFKGEIHEYNPDLKVVFDDGHTEIWEFKPSNQTHLPINKAKWTACQNYCEARGYGFMVLTEIGLDKLKKEISNQN